MFTLIKNNILDFFVLFIQINVNLYLTTVYNFIFQIISPQSIESNSFNNTIYLQLDELPVKENSSSKDTSKYVSEAQPSNSVSKN